MIPKQMIKLEILYFISTEYINAWYERKRTT